MGPTSNQFNLTFWDDGGGWASAFLIFFFVWDVQLRSTDVEGDRRAMQGGKGTQVGTDMKGARIGKLGWASCAFEAKTWPHAKAM